MGDDWRHRLYSSVYRLEYFILPKCNFIPMVSFHVPFSRCQFITVTETWNSNMSHLGHIGITH